MSGSDAQSLIEQYYAAFNTGNTQAMQALVSDDIIHDVNQGERRQGKEKFWAFNVHMARCYKEQLKEIVIMVNADGSRAAAEFIVEGEYLHTDEGLPPAKGQRYTLPAGTFFEIAGGQITRVTTYYNLEDWMAQVTG